jgi:LacI family transcriptional regulator
VPQRVTIADVARLAGVSTMTVSRVINAKSDVGSATRARVEEAIAALEYRPSAMARGLSTRRSKTIGLLVPDITNPFFPAIVRGAEDVAWAEGHAVSLTNAVEDVERERAALRHFEGHRVDGLIVCSARLPDDDLAVLLRRHPATVLINRAVPVDPTVGTPVQASSLEVDDALGARLAVAHLVTRGRRRIGLLAGPARSASSHKRRAGFRAELAAAGLAGDGDRIEDSEPTEAAGREACFALLTRHPELDAVVCYNDVVAVGTLQAAAALGRRVPRDLAVVGCDDIRLASLVTPALTTLRTDTYELGRRAAEMLFALMRGEEPRAVVVPPHLVVRASAP